MCAVQTSYAAVVLFANKTKPNTQPNGQSVSQLDFWLTATD